MPAIFPAADTSADHVSPAFPHRAILQHLRQGYCLLELLFDEQGTVVDCRFLEVNAAFAEQTGLSAAVGHTLRELRPQAEDHWLALLEEATRTGQAQHVERPTHRSGPRWVDVDVLPSGPAGGAQVAVLLTDTTARKQAEQQQAFRLHLADVLRPLLDPVAVEAAATRTALTYFGADRCYYCTLREGKAIIQRDAMRGELPSVAGTYELAQFPLLQAVIDYGQPFVVEDVRTSSLVDENLRQLCVQLEVIAFLNVPLIKQGRAVGELCVVQRTPRTWTALETNLAIEVAERTWVAVEHAHAEEALRASEEKYRTVFTAMNEGFSLLDLQFNAQGEVDDIIIRAVNPAQQRIDGVRAQVGQRVRELLPEIEPAWLQRYAQVARTGQPLQFEDWSAATQRWYEVSASRVGAAGSSLVAIVYTDITVRKQTQERLRVATEAAQLGTWDWDVARDEVRWNAWHFRLLGLEPSDQLLTAADFIRFVHPADLPQVRRRLQAALDGPVPYDAEFRVVTAQGEERWMSGHGQATRRDASGQAWRLSGVMLDITARKQAEQAGLLRQQLLQQQQQVTAVLEGQEEERRRIAESLHNGIGQVLFATKLQLDQLPPHPNEPGWVEARLLLTDAIQQTRAVSHELTPALLAEFGLQVALETICRQLNAPGLQWHCYIDLEGAPALPAVLQQAAYRLVQGLAHNVAKHAQASEVTIEVTALPNWLVLHLEDNGQGFDPGTVREGLGLRTLRSRVALLGGTVQLHAAPGQGTQIVVRLPIAATDQPACG